MKIYENANDQHVRKVVIYEVSAGLAFDKAGTELLTKEEIVDAFLKGCVVENEGNYKTPTGVNVTDSGAELVFGGGGSGGPVVVTFTENTDETIESEVVSDMTPEEIVKAMANNIVIGVLDLAGDMVPLGPAQLLEGQDVGFMPLGGNVDERGRVKYLYFIYSEDLSPVWLMNGL